MSAAERLFAVRGFEVATVDDVAVQAGVAKGAVYHHFVSKEAIFARVLDKVQAAVAVKVVAAARSARNPRDAIERAARAFLKACLDAGTRQIVLIDGPAVLGWKKWREIDEKYFSALLQGSVAQALGVSQPTRETNAVAQLLLGAVTEAALTCATAENAEAALRDHMRGLRVLLRGVLAGG